MADCSDSRRYSSLPSDTSFFSMIISNIQGPVGKESPINPQKLTHAGPIKTDSERVCNINCQVQTDCEGARIRQSKKNFTKERMKDKDTLWV